MKTDMTYKEYARIAADKVLTLGGTADEIAASLTRLGCKGSPRNAEDCVMHNYLTNEVEELDPVSDDIMVSTNAIHVGTAVIVGPQHADEDVITLPAHVWEFIERYDHQDWPGLNRTDLEDFDDDEDDFDDEDDDFDYDDDLDEDEDEDEDEDDLDDEEE